MKKRVHVGIGNELLSLASLSDACVFFEGDFEIVWPDVYFPSHGD